MKPFIRIGDYVYRLASKQVMYHGTASGPDGEILRKILKQGTDPAPAQKVYDRPAQNPKDRKKRELESYGGTYFSTSLDEAFWYAVEASNKFGGRQVLIIAQLETRTPEVTLDEDQFLNTLSLSTDTFRKVLKLPRGTTALEMWDLLVKGKINLDKHVETFLRDYVLLPEAPIAVELDQLMRHQKKFSELFRLDLEHEAAEEYLAFDDRELSLYDVPERSPEEILEEYRDKANKLYVKFTSLADPVDRSRRNVRILKPLTYRGANRIIGVLSWERKLRNRVPWFSGTIHYSADDSLVESVAMSHKMEDWSSLRGNWEWVDSSGKVIMGKDS